MVKKLPTMRPGDPARKLPEHEQVDRAARIFPERAGDPVKSGDYATSTKDSAPCKPQT